MDFYFQTSFIPPHHCVRTKGSALTFMDRVHSSDGSASFAPVHIRIQNHTVAAAASPYALAHFPAYFREGGRRGVTRDERKERRVENGVKDGKKRMGHGGRKTGDGGEKE